jgi:CheY-like chemotaxis protein
LADDDSDDQLFFKQALTELPVSTSLVAVNNGEQLMRYLYENALPDILFLDLNMPRKDGITCLKEIKENKKFAALAIIALSTSLNPDVISNLYKLGVIYLFKKPNEIVKLNEDIIKSLKIAETHIHKNKAGVSEN